MNHVSFLAASRRARVAFQVLAAALFLSAALVAPAQAQFSGSAVPFLRIEPDSRSAAMGNSGVALADNVNAIYWNPAGLAFQRGAEIALTHANWLPEFPDANLFYEYLTGKYHVDGVGTFGGHVTYFNLGEHELRIGPGEDGLLGDFRSYEFAVGASYGRQLSETFAIGTGARMIYSKLASEDTQGNTIDPGTSFGIDLAALYRTRPFTLGSTQTTFSAGANLANFGPAITYVEEASSIPTNLRVGYAFTFDFDEYNSLTFTNDFNKLLTRSDTTADGFYDADGPFQALFSSWGAATVVQGEEANEVSALDQIIIGTGLEYWYNQLFALRTGYFYEHPDNGNRQLLTFGAGLRYNIVGVDFSYIYALEEDSPLSGQMRFSLLIDFAQQ